MRYAFVFFFQAEDGIRDLTVTGVQTCALPILHAYLSIAVPWYLDSSLTCGQVRSEEHTSELQSQSNLVCRLLLEKKKKNMNPRCTNMRTMNEVRVAAGSASGRSFCRPTIIQHV